MSGRLRLTIDSILIGESTDHEKRREWLQANGLRFSVIRPEITHPGCKPLP